MATSRGVKFVLLVALALAPASCFHDSAPADPQETLAEPVVHPMAAQQCIDSFVQCYAACETNPSSCDEDFTDPLCFASLTRITQCHEDCGKLYGCMPWDVGVETGLPCRWSDDRFDCNFALCSMASDDCIQDCFNVFGQTNPQEGWMDQCIDHCYDHYGCRPKPSDPCDPLPDGWVMCGCPDEHGVECHAPGPTCSH
jgi:hypothetical protein